MIQSQAQLATGTSMLEQFFQDIQAHGFSSIDNLIDAETIRKLANWSGNLHAQNHFKEAKFLVVKFLIKRSEETPRTGSILLLLLMSGAH